MFIDIDDAYILDETGAQVDKVTGLFTKNENATAPEKAQARANIAAGGSNDNLLDNAYFVGGGSQLGDGVFPINQRGQTSYSGSTYGIDRWRTWASSTTVSLTASGLTFATGTYSDGLFQYFPQGQIESLYGLTVTASLLLTDGTLYTATGVAAAECWIATEINGGYFGYTNGFLRINLDANKSITIKAVKLEKGTVSTLANDPPPDFGEELRKCQRYLWVEKFPANTIIGSGITFNTNTIYDIVTPVAMRPGGVLTMTTSTSLYVVYNAIYALAGVVNGITSHGNHLRVSMNNNGGSDYGALNHADLLVSYETVVTVANEP